MVMLCLQTSCHRCPSALHNRLVTSTPSLSPLSHPPRTRRRVVDHGDGVGTRIVARTAAVTRKTLAWPLAGPRRRHTGGRKTRRRSRRLRGLAGGDGVLARSRDARKTNLPHRYAVAARKYYFVSLNYPQKTPPERETLAQLRPVHGLHAHRL